MDGATVVQHSRINTILEHRARMGRGRGRSSTMIMAAASAFIIGLYTFIHDLWVLSEVALMISLCFAAATGSRTADRR